MVGPGAAHDIDFDFLQKSLPKDGSVHLSDKTNQYGVFVLAGPNARSVLQKIADADMSNESFK